MIQAIAGPQPQFTVTIPGIPDGGYSSPSMESSFVDDSAIENIFFPPAVLHYLAARLAAQE